MAAYIVVPEGLAIDKTNARFQLSDYYRSVLDLLILRAKDDDMVYLAPANKFGAHQPEDYFGRDYLLDHHFKPRVEVISDGIERKGYLSTLDNALYLKKHLLDSGRWDKSGFSIICNRPHKWRVYWMFRITGYRIQSILTSMPERKSGSTMVKRLWFYDVPVVQYVYEFVALIYNTTQFIFLKSK